MKINSLSIRGFRGFNQEQTIEFNPTLTIIYAPNSYGKTSITESVEWLLYGRTSKVDRGESKDEYKGSYRNCHLDSSMSAWVKARFSSQAKQIEFEAELVGEDGFNRCVDG
ncbi:MAG: ATP-binding protein, partial [Dehalococcoidia bacterium]|nr:ATP-binding protein [Dehalococcoidia bacterium]